MKLLNKVKYFFVRLLTTVKLFLTAKYRRLYELATLKLLAVTSKMVRKLIIMKGKDPDYVPPPPPPPPPPAPLDPYEEFMAKRKKFTYIQQVWRPEWVKNRTEHPVLKARAQFAEKQAKPKTVSLGDIITVTEPGEIVIPVTFEDVPQEQPLQVTAQEGSDHEQV